MKEFKKFIQKSSTWVSLELLHENRIKVIEDYLEEISKPKDNFTWYTLQESTPNIGTTIFVETNRGDALEGLVQKVDITYIYDKGYIMDKKIITTLVMLHIPKPPHDYIPMNFLPEDIVKWRYK